MKVIASTGQPVIRAGESEVFSLLAFAVQSEFRRAARYTNRFKPRRIEAHVAEGDDGAPEDRMTTVVGAGVWIRLIERHAA